jgi:hypothetical protein
LSTVSNYIETLANFNGANVGNFDTEGQIVDRELELAIPPLTSALQTAALNALAQYGDTLGVTVKFVVLE